MTFKAIRPEVGVLQGHNDRLRDLMDSSSYFIRVGCSHTIGSSHPTGRVAHVLQVRLGLLFPKFLKDLLDVVAALGGKCVSYCANLRDNRVISHRRCPLSYTRKTFITSSPRWLMTLTAMRPEVGLGKGREVSLWRVSQASWLISAFRVVLRDL